MKPLRSIEYAATRLCDKCGAGNFNVSGKCKDCAKQRSADWRLKKNGGPRIRPQIYQKAEGRKLVLITPNKKECVTCGAEFLDVTGRRSNCSKACRYKKAPVIDRFQKKFYVTPGCWIWGAATNGKKGYGIFGVKAKDMQLAHRLSYEFYVGEIPCGIMVLHRCDNPKCVNPDHLFLGTNTDNVHDMIEKGRNVVRYGDNNPATRLKFKDVLAIRSDTREGKYIAADYGIRRDYVYSIKSGKVRKAA